MSAPPALSQKAICLYVHKMCRYICIPWLQALGSNYECQRNAFQLNASLIDSATQNFGSYFAFLPHFFNNCYFFVLNSGWLSVQLASQSIFVQFVAIIVP